MLIKTKFSVGSHQQGDKHTSFQIDTNCYTGYLHFLFRKID